MRLGSRIGDRDEKRGTATTKTTNSNKQNNKAKIKYHDKNEKSTKEQKVMYACEIMPLDVPLKARDHNDATQTSSREPSREPDHHVAQQTPVV